MSEYKDILFEVDQRIATVTINLPDIRNAISQQQTVEEIEDACRRVQYSNDISVMILTGAGKAFSSGGNIKNMRDRNNEFAGGPIALQEWYRRGIQRIPQAIDRVDVPVIAAVNGPAVGAGCDLALMCDIRIASTEAKFGETFLNLGLIPGDGGSWFLTRLVGYAKAAELTFTGRMVDATEALELGMVNKVVPHEELMSQAREMAASMADKPPRTLRMSKLLLKQAMRTELKDFLDICAQTQGVAQTSNDHKEAIEAFFEKRPPVFTGE